MIETRADEIFKENLRSHRAGLDRLFAVFLVAQWVAGIVIALVVSPHTWIGDQNMVQLHVWIALIQGGLVTLPSCYLAWKYPGKMMTRSVIAVSQCFFASMFVHLTGGRIETHFHYFGSLAYLAFYRDWRVIVLGTLYIALDHFARGVFWPLSAFGVVEGTGFRWLEHAGWVVVMDVVLFLGCARAIKEVRTIADEQAQIEDYSANMESMVDERTKQLAAAKHETDSIIDAVDEGLFILHNKDDQYLIGSEQSKAMHVIMERSDIAGGNFVSVLAPIIPPKTLNAVNDYLNLIFAPGADADVIRDLNPLEKVEVSIQVPESSTPAGVNGKLQTKNLEFRFKRIPQEDEVVQYLVNVRDITEQTKLAGKLLESEKRTRQQTDMLLAILHVDPDLLRDFVAGVEEDLATIDGILKQQTSGMPVEEMLHTIFRCAHSIKGNAGLLNLGFFAARAHEFEDMLAAVQEQKSITWNDFIPLALGLATLQQAYADIQELTSRIQSFQARDNGQVQSSAGLIGPATAEMIQRLADEGHKKVRFVYDEFQAAEVPNRYNYMLRDVLIQFAKNSLAHGIEAPEERTSLGKPEVGTIHLAAKKSDGCIEICYRDDGQGLRLEDIRSKAVAMGLISSEDAETAEKSQLVKFIFEPGFSTSSSTSLLAGRGMGMDIIRRKLQGAHAGLRVHFEPGKFTEFKFTLPQ